LRFWVKKMKSLKVTISRIEQVDLPEIINPGLEVWRLMPRKPRQLPSRHVGLLSGPGCVSHKSVN